MLCVCVCIGILPKESLQKLQEFRSQSLYFSLHGISIDLKVCVSSGYVDRNRAFELIFYSSKMFWFFFCNFTQLLKCELSRKQINIQADVREEKGFVSYPPFLKHQNPKRSIFCPLLI